MVHNCGHSSAGHGVDGNGSAGRDAAAMTETTENHTDIAGRVGGMVACRDRAVAGLMPIPVPGRGSGGDANVRAGRRVAKSGSDLRVTSWGGACGRCRGFALTECVARIFAAGGLFHVPSWDGAAAHALLFRVRICIRPSRTLKLGRGLLTVSGGFGQWPRAQRPQHHRVTASDASQELGMLNFARGLGRSPALGLGRTRPAWARTWRRKALGRADAGSKGELFAMPAPSWVAMGARRRCEQCGDPPLLDSIHTCQLCFVKETSLPCLLRVAGSTRTSNDPSTTDF